MTKDNLSTPISQHSRYATASFVISLLVGAMGLLSLGLLLVLLSPTWSRIFSTPYGNFSPLAFLSLACTAFCGGPLALFAGIPLGIAGILRKNKSKRLAILGIVINVLAVLGIAIAVILFLSLPVQY